MCPGSQVQPARSGHTYDVDDRRRRASSWPASLLPTMLLVGLLTAGVGAATNTGDDAPILDMTVTTSK
jgi:hypothetical protein